jgi:hypothetical protein
MLMTAMTPNADLHRSEGQPHVGLFITCLVDLFRPSAGFASIKLLEGETFQTAWKKGKRGVCMSHARDEILSRLRQSLHRQGPPEPAALLQLEQHMAQLKTHVQPRLDEDLTQRFITKLKAVHVTIDQVNALKAVTNADTKPQDHE